MTNIPIDEVFRDQVTYTQAIEKTRSSIWELRVELCYRLFVNFDLDSGLKFYNRLRDEKQKAQLENLGRDELQKRITDMSAFLQEQPTALAEYNEALVRRLIEKVTVYEDKFTVEFKSGLKVDVNE